MRVAVLVDAAFFLRRYKKIVTGAESHSGQDVAKALHRWACDHTRFDSTGKFGDQELYRIFVYDCPPFMGRLHHPVSKRLIDFAKTDLAKFMQSFHEALPQLRKVALRLGHLSDARSWKLKADAMELLLRGKLRSDEITEDHVMLDVSQKGVDMRIGEIRAAGRAAVACRRKNRLISGDREQRGELIACH